jgi:hypothetical protein
MAKSISNKGRHEKLDFIKLETSELQKVAQEKWRKHLQIIYLIKYLCLGYVFLKTHSLIKIKITQS